MTAVRFGFGEGVTQFVDVVVDLLVGSTIPPTRWVFFELRIAVHFWSAVLCPKTVGSPERRNAAFDRHSSTGHTDYVFGLVDDRCDLADRYM